MNVLFKSLRLRGFRSFAEEVRVEFASSGLVRVSGINREDPELQANGVGKSTLFEGLHWVLFGCTSFGERGPSLRNWSSASTVSGELETEIDGTLHSLRRTQSPNCLELDGRPIAQEELEGKWFSPLLFQNAVMLSQFGDCFADLSPTEQLSVYGDLLQLHIWDEARARAKEHATTLSKRLEMREKDVAYLKGELKARREEADRAEIEEFRLVRSVISNSRKFSDQQREAEKEVERLREELPDPPEKFDGDKDLEKARRELENVSRDLERAKVKIETLEKEVEQEKRFVDVCSKCGQELRGSAKNRIEEAREKTLKTLKTLRDSVGHMGGEKKRCLSTISELETRKKERDTLFLEYVGKNKTAISELARAEAGKEGAKASLARELARLDFRQPHEDFLAKVQGLQQRLREKEEGLGEDRAALASATLWDKLFKELKLYVLDDSLAQLNLHANSILEDLGMVGWEIQADVARETKSGTVRHGFLLRLKKPGGELLPIKSYSGGEQRRAKIAMQLALSSVVRDRVFTTNLLLLDEPTTHLSLSGIESLLQVLKDVSKDCEVWVADHRALEVVQFDRSFLIEKDEAGSHFLRV